MTVETAARTQGSSQVGTHTDARGAMENYFRILMARGDYGKCFTPDATFSLEGNDMAASGATDVEQTIRFMHEVAFDAYPVLCTLLVDGDKAAAELEFVATHTGEFAGVAATGRHVSVPYSVVYDLRDGKIAALRIYMALSALLAQLGAGQPAPAAG